MNKHYLQSQIKSTGTSYLLWFFFGFHYAYLGMWGVQILYWFTFGGLGFWTFIDLFTIPGKVSRYNANIFQKINAIEKRERQEDHLRNIELITAANKNGDKEHKPLERN